MTISTKQLGEMSAKPQNTVQDDICKQVIFKETLGSFSGQQNFFIFNKILEEFAAENWTFSSRVCRDGTNFESKEMLSFNIFMVCRNTHCQHLFCWFGCQNMLDHIANLIINTKHIG